MVQINLLWYNFSQKTNSLFQSVGNTGQITFLKPCFMSSVKTTFSQER